ncbi:MAG: hypothetical protein MUF15_03580 [Acidobacteria bacterium]|jgi:hypothetical protein|nr:hypothetical protein [Acidobacteriota bacterium]
MKKFFIICTVFFIFNITCFPRVNNNDVDRGYIVSVVAFNGNNLIKDYIIIGANLYLSAAADIQNLIKMIEVQDSQEIDLIQLNKLTESALAHMQNACDDYKKLIEIAEITPYNGTIQVALRNFDYTTFMLENDLNEKVFENIEKLLKCGDITGALRKTYSYFLGISALLNNIKADASASRLTDVKTFWKLNEACAEASLFGSYVTRIFFSLR